jgi:hypothetical protein
MSSGTDSADTWAINKSTEKNTIFERKTVRTIFGPVLEDNQG